MLTLTRRRALATGASVLGATNLVATASALAAQNVAPEACTTRAPMGSWNNIPEFKSGSPKRTSFLEPGMEGERITLTGRVLTPRCTPLVGARLEFWHTDHSGKYDYVGHLFRGYQLTDKDGRYRLETIRPGYYNPRRHFHFLLGAYIKDPLNSTLKTGSIGLPTESEFETGAAGAGVPPAAILRKDGVLIAPYDFILDIA